VKDGCLVAEDRFLIFQNGRLVAEDRFLIRYNFLVCHISSFFFFAAFAVYDGWTFRLVT
jgi:hypothetical protein